jgi:hypothetical protein
MVNRNLRGVNSKKVAQVLKQLTDQHLFNDPNGVIANKEVIHAFGMYTILHKKGSYNVYKSNVLRVQTGSSRSALAWCIANKYNIDALAQKIVDFDRLFYNKKNEIHHYTAAMHENKDLERRYILFNRLEQSILYANKYKEQLNKCINSAKYWQQKGFENETSRLGIKPTGKQIAEGI